MPAMWWRTVMRWSRAARTPRRILVARVGWPSRMVANGAPVSSSWLVNSRIASRASWPSRCPSSTRSTGVRPRSDSSAARASRAWGTRVAVWKLGRPPRAVTMWWNTPRAPTVGAVERGAGGHGFADADLTGDDGDAAGVDAVGDAGGGLGVVGELVERAGGEITAVWHAGETVERLDFVEHGGRSSATGVVAGGRCRRWVCGKDAATT